MIRKRNGYGWKLITIGMLTFGLLLIPVHASGQVQENKALNVLVVFSSQTGEVDEHQRLLDMLISHFTTNLSFKSTGEVQESDMNGITHLFYYGQIEEVLPKSFLQLLDSYNGSFIAIGNNIEQLDQHFSFIKMEGTTEFNEIFLSGNEEKSMTVDTQKIKNVHVEDYTEILIEAKQGESVYPMFVRQNERYYYASDNLFPPISNYFAEVLHDVFKENHPETTQAYLRLEDIHPRVNPAYVEEIAEFLKSRNIPYMASVVPVYVDPKTDEEYHLSETPELVKALKEMQENGGSIILHGYTDQYHNGATGDGFEFWNLEKNMPVYQEPGAKTAIQTKDNFARKSGYELYMEDRMAFETNYIANKLERGIQELVNYGLYPLAFEAPHYAMSQNGYKVVSNYFSTYVGQIQLTDEDWKVMAEASTISSPTFLQGMTLLPETIRYVHYDNPESIQLMKERVNDFSIVRDGVIGGFYHPFLGVEGLVDLINEMEKIPGVEWIDLKDMNNTVTMEHFTIKTKNGKLIKPNFRKEESGSASSEFPLYLIKFSKDNALWFLIGTGSTTIMVCASIMLRRNRRLKRS